jgi:hypothetical protein
LKHLLAHIKRTRQILQEKTALTAARDMVDETPGSAHMTHTFGIKAKVYGESNSMELSLQGQGTASGAPRQYIIPAILE